MGFLIGWAAIAAAWWAWYKFRNWEDRVADARFLEERRRHYAEAEIARLERLAAARKCFEDKLRELEEAR